MNILQLTALLNGAGGERQHATDVLATAIKEGELDKIDEICDRYQITPEQLAEQPDALIIEWVREGAPDKDKDKEVNVKSVRRAAREYAAENYGLNS